MYAIAPGLWGWVGMLFVGGLIAALAALQGSIERQAQSTGKVLPWLAISAAAGVLAIRALVQLLGVSGAPVGT